MELYYLIWLATTSAVTFALYGYDKQQAKKKRRACAGENSASMLVSGWFFGRLAGTFNFPA